MTRKNNQGFTMIELIMVIVILGIITSIAAPRFIDFRGDAQLARMQSNGATLTSAVNMAVMKWHVSGKPEAIAVDGQKIVFKGGAPTPDTVLNLVAGLERDRDVVFTDQPGQVDGCRLAYVFMPGQEPAWAVDVSGITSKHCQ
jgi:MSHA pilin protein MshA